jgi:deazaflavin-dependent oxidoreductase (nitroreductase family)
VVANDDAVFTRQLIADMRAHDGEVTSGPMAGWPLMILMTTGRKTGRGRRAIVTYTRHGSHYVIAASNRGSPTNPTWFHNLDVHPEVMVEAAGEVFRARARVATGAERDRLWEQHVVERPEVRVDPANTKRVIPMILLDRID